MTLVASGLVYGGLALFLFAAATGATWAFMLPLLAGIVAATGLCVYVLGRLLGLPAWLVVVLGAVVGVAVAEGAAVLLIEGGAPSANARAVYGMLGLLCGLGVGSVMANLRTTH